MKKELIAISLAAMLVLTACGEAKTSDTTLEKTTESTVATETTTESEPIAEVTETEAITINTEPITVEPTTKKTFQHAEGLSDKYVDFDNKSVVFKGHLLTIGKTTYQELIDEGLPFNSEIDADKELKYREIKGNTLKTTDDNFVVCQFVNTNNDIIQAKDAVLNFISFQPSRGGASETQFAFPYDLTLDELIENSGEPTKRDDGSFSVTYSSDDNGSYTFNFTSEEYSHLSSVIISWNP